jgi:hypothetical protein
MLLQPSKKYLYFTFLYMIAVLGAAYYYCVPNKKAMAIVENMEISALRNMHAPINESCTNTLKSIKEEVSLHSRFPNPYTTAQYTKAKYLYMLADSVQTRLTYFENKNIALTQKQKDSASAIVKAFYTKIEKTFEMEENKWKDWQDKLFNLENLEKINNTALYLQALRSAIVKSKQMSLNYYLDRFSSGDKIPESYVITTQLENTAIKAGEPVKGWFGLGALRRTYLDTIYINGKPFVTSNSFVDYKTKPQAAGKYPLVITSKFMVRDTLIRVCDTLYYTVR